MKTTYKAAIVTVLAILAIAAVTAGFVAVLSLPASGSPGDANISASGARPRPTMTPPPVGALCTYTADLFTDSSTCPNPSDASVCALRHASPRAACVRDACTAGAYQANVTYPLSVALPSVTYNVSFRVNASSLMAAVLRGIVGANAGTPGLFTASTQFTQSFLALGSSAFQTSAQQLVRQLVVALWNQRLTVTYDNSTSQLLFDRLVFNGDGCSGLPAWLNGSVRLTDLIEFARFVVGVNVAAPPANFALLPSLCGSTLPSNPLCSVLVGRAAPTLADPVSGQSLASALSSALTLYNQEYDNCDRVATGCLVLQAPL